MPKRICTLPECGQPHRAQGLCAKHWKQQFGKRTTYTITCVTCRQEHQSGRSDGKYCSDECKGVAYAQHGAGPHCKIPMCHSAHPYWAGRLAVVKYRGPRSMGTRPAVLPMRVWYSGQCQRCSTWFMSDQPANRYCTRSCSKADAKARRRALKKNAFIAPVYRRRVFERDRWRCQLCGKKTKPHEVVPHPHAPVLDHIIPLAKGGTHEPANVQCAHFICNSMKRDQAYGEQLMLIG